MAINGRPNQTKTKVQPPHILPYRFIGGFRFLLHFQLFCLQLWHCTIYFQHGYYPIISSFYLGFLRFCHYILICIHKLKIVHSVVESIKWRYFIYLLAVLALSYFCISLYIFLHWEWVSIHIGRGVSQK